MPEKRLLPYFLILGAGILWGGTFSLALIATAQGAHPLGLSTWQVVLTAAFFLAVCVLSRIPVFRRENLRHYAVIAVIGITAPNLFYYYGAPHLSAGILAITVSTVPMFTYAIILLMRFEAIALRRLSGILVGMIAVLLLVLPDLGLDSGDASFWILLVILSSVLYAVENVYISRAIGPAVDIRELLVGSNLIAILLQFPLALYLGVAEPWAWLATDAGLAIGGIAIGSGIAYMMFFHTIRSSGPVFASQCAYPVTISGVIWGIIVFREQHSPWVWVSVMVMLLGLALVTPDDRARSAGKDGAANAGPSF